MAAGRVPLASLCGPGGAAWDPTGKSPLAQVRGAKAWGKRLTPLPWHHRVPRGVEPWLQPLIFAQSKHNRFLPGPRLEVIVTRPEGQTNKSNHKANGTILIHPQVK